MFLLIIIFVNVKDLTRQVHLYPNGNGEKDHTISIISIVTLFRRSSKKLNLHTALFCTTTLFISPKKKKKHKPNWSGPYDSCLTLQVFWSHIICERRQSHPISCSFESVSWIQEPDHSFESKLFNEYSWFSLKIWLINSLTNTLISFDSLSSYMICHHWLEGSIISE